MRRLSLRRPPLRARRGEATEFLRRLPRNAVARAHGLELGTDESVHAVPRPDRYDGKWPGRQHTPAHDVGGRPLSAQQAFDADVARAMSRRQFFVRLARASAAAILVSSPLGCGTMRGRVE